MTSTPRPTPKNEASLVVVAGSRIPVAAASQINVQKKAVFADITFSLARKKTLVMAKRTKIVNSICKGVSILS